jgi:hypothetical protein
MRETNFCFPAQNRASVCISSQLYDRRGTSPNCLLGLISRFPALDTNSALPLFNSLTHLVYLTSTSPRIREIMTMDGGLERLIRILHDFCISPPPPENPSVYYGLLPPNYRPAKPQPVLNPRSFDRHAAYRFSLAFQCVVNIGVRGSEPIRSRVVQAGALDVVGCILEAWLVSKGYSLGPSSSATGIPRETREQRAARRALMAKQRENDQRPHITVTDIARILEQQQQQIQQTSQQDMYDHARISRRRHLPEASLLLVFSLSRDSFSSSPWTFPLTPSPPPFLAHPPRPMTPIRTHPRMCQPLKPPLAPARPQVRSRFRAETEAARL